MIQLVCRSRTKQFDPDS